MNFNNDKYFGASREYKIDNNAETEKEPAEDKILNSNNVGLIAEYAKKNRSKEATDKVRKLLEIARRTGEKVVQTFLNSFKECEAEKISYLYFESTVSGKTALSCLEEMPEPFRTNAYKKLEDYKKELVYNNELFKEHKNHPEKIWKEVFGFDYYNVPDFKERFTTFLFKDVEAISKKYYKKNDISVQQDPFSVNFYVEDIENFNKARGKSDNVTAAFSTKKDKTNVTVMGVEKGSKAFSMSSSREEIHEREHNVHRITKPFNSVLFDDAVLGGDSDFLGNIYLLNNHVKWDYEERLKKASDEMFAYFKNKEDKENVEYFLGDKSEKSPYDYSSIIRQKNNEEINKSTVMSGEEKQKLKNGIDFLQSEYERVLKNMIDVVYNHHESVEYLRCLPINEWHKASNEKYKRTDFIIKEFKP